MIQSFAMSSQLKSAGRRVHVEISGDDPSVPPSSCDESINKIKLCVYTEQEDQTILYLSEWQSKAFILCYSLILKRKLSSTAGPLALNNSDSALQFANRHIIILQFLYVKTVQECKTVKANKDLYTKLLFRTTLETF